MTSAAPQKAAVAGRIKIAIGTIVLLISAFLLFASLGTYALWDDETETALGAEGVLLTGDTTSIIGHNLVARRAGINVHKLHDRFTPPLPVYLTAASMALFGKTAWAARFPFALAGLATVALMLHILWRQRASTLAWLLTGIAIVGNVSLFLYFRQARYYGVVIFLTVLIGYIYLHWKGRRWEAFAISLASAGLFLSNQICFLEVNTVLLFDYLAFRRKYIPISKLSLSWLLTPQLLIIAITSLVWNPFLTKSEDHLHSITPQDRLTLFWWNLRDLNQAEFGVGLLLLAGAVAVVWHKNQWILRGLLAIFFTLFVASAVSHQTISATAVADIRYVVSLIPICIAVGVMSIESLAGRIPWLAVTIAIVAFGTNILHNALLSPEKCPEHACKFCQRTASSSTRTLYSGLPMGGRKCLGGSVWVAPEHMAYPLMFHAPNAIYAWQLTQKDDLQFAKLDRIHFQGEVPPQYIIAFGPVVEEIVKLLNAWSAQGVRYRHIATLDTFWRDLYRPEIFWRTFKPVKDYNKNAEAIYIFKLSSDAQQGN